MEIKLWISAANYADDINILDGILYENTQKD